MNKFLLEDFAGGAVAERIRCAIQEVYETLPTRTWRQKRRGS